ncbi:hypothetical protein SCOCK_140121 [Actinacidiphila cocklensis]|uniref:Uncharacterized protein n=1 Tax=Actinacidiphila cocklensis TaxID=887465 RepID=A0A9W4DLN4_9ACTN|nr:hypothetical protein SCOCK_140121 [Actinacidiphila cocklensis]
MLAVACSHQITTRGGKLRVDALAAKLPKRAWQKLSAGVGAKGQRFYDWAVIDLAEPRPGCHQLLIRRNRTTRELAYYRCWSFAPAPLPLPTLVRVAGSPGRRVAGSRWRVEMAGGGGIPSRKGPGRPGRTPASPLHLVVPLGHPGHARPCLPRCAPRRRTHPPARPGRTNSTYLQRDPATVHHTRRQTHT